MIFPTCQDSWEATTHSREEEEKLHLGRTQGPEADIQQYSILCVKIPEEVEEKLHWDGKTPDGLSGSEVSSDGVHCRGEYCTFTHPF